MTEDPREIVRRPLRFHLPGMEAVKVREELPFTGGDGEPLALDLYRPPGAPPDLELPAVVFVSGFPDPGAEAMLGAKLKDWTYYRQWARVVAASGMTAVTYSNRVPADDARALLAHLEADGPALGIDPSRIGVWACSGNAPNALSLLFEPVPTRPACAVLCYGYLLDDDETTGVADASKAHHFVNPAQGRSVDELPREVPILVVRAGGDETPGLNVSIDRFLTAALQSDLPVSSINHPDAPHAFDLEQEEEASAPVLVQVLAFLRARLGEPPADGSP